MRFPAFIGGAYEAASHTAACHQLINWFVEPNDIPGATSPATLYPTPGVQEFCRFTTSGGRGMFAGEGRVFAVVGPTLYEVYANGSTTARGSVALDHRPVTISTNGDGGQQLFITSGGNGYVYDLLTDTLTQVLTGGIVQGGMLYGYFVAFDEVNRRVRISDLFDGLTWDPLEFFQRTIGADLWQALHVDPYGYIFLPGSKTGESWFNNGAASVPFEPDRSALIEEGIAAPFSIQQAGKSKVWLSTNANGGYQVQRATGFTPQRISTHALEQAIAGYGDVSDAIGATYEERGHAFYLLTFPRVPVTWVYNFATNSWHRQGTWIAEENRFTYWRPAFHAFGFSKHLALDRESNVLYEVSEAFGTDIEDRPIRRLRRTPAVVNETGMVFHDRFELRMDVGLGVATGASEDMTPEVMLRVSDDLGQTWGPERRASAGAIGAYHQRVQWWGLGAARGRVYEVSVSAAVPWRISDAFLQVRRSREVA